MQNTTLSAPTPSGPFHAIKCIEIAAQGDRLRSLASKMDTPTGLIIRGAKPAILATPVFEVPRLPRFRKAAWINQSV